jgi:hypothetical protein
MTLTPANLKAPFPAFGGKSQVADLVWERFGNPRNYVEPFCFSAAMLLKRPNIGAIETVNDRNSYVANFWRAIKNAPDLVAEYADWPVVEDDLHARHRWLVSSSEALAKLDRVRTDPEFFDAKVAGWWCWGACCWIGSGWCEEQQLPHLTAGQGVNGLTQKLPHMDGAGRGILNTVDELHLDQKRPVISADGSEFGRGIHGEAKIMEGRGTALQSPRHVHAMEGHRPQLADAFSRGRGVNGNDALGTCDKRRQWLTAWFQRLADRIRPVRVCCGHWARVCDSDSTLIRLGLTGVFLDPPYRHTVDGEENRAKHIYANDKHQDIDALCDEVQEWCLKWGETPDIRIALCGLEGEYPKLDAAGWDVVPWKSRGGYGNRTERGKENAARERIWFNRNCIQPTLGGLFAESAP